MQHNSTLKQNYKNLEEEHYKTKEQLEKFTFADSPRHSEEAVNAFGCKKCAKHFRSNELLEAHIKRRHQHNKPPAQVDDDRELNAEKEKEIDDVKCEAANKEFKEKSNMKVAKSTENIAAEGSESKKTKETNNVKSICSECEVRKKPTATEASIQCSLDDAVANVSAVHKDDEKTNENTAEKLRAQEDGKFSP